jgi:hypothetical protein
VTFHSKHAQRISFGAALREDLWKLS